MLAKLLKTHAEVKHPTVSNTYVWHGVEVMRFIQSTKLLYDEPGQYLDGWMPFSR